MAKATKPAPCQVRDKTGTPSPCRAEVEICGVAFCGPCAREQEAYFAIGELADGEALERMRWVRADSTADITARMHQGPSGVRGTESLALPFN